MPLPTTTVSPPFDITRASHVSLNVCDLEASRRFYEDLIGLVVTHAEDEVIYLRGVEEACHHSLVLHRAATAGARRIGMRVRSESDLEAASAWFEERGLPAEFVDLPFQGPTLHACDVAGTPLELVAAMPTVPRQIISFDTFRGAAPTGLDHYQVHVPDPEAAASMYAELGFRTSEFVSVDGSTGSSVFAAFMARKGNANDIVLLSNKGPRLHHFAYVIHDAATNQLRVCDLASALGFAASVEWGPARHGLGYELFLYLRDPDGHRIEILGHPYQFIDEDEEPFGWAADNTSAANLFGPPPTEDWFNQASEFEGVPVAASVQGLPQNDGAPN